MENKNVPWSSFRHGVNWDKTKYPEYAGFLFYYWFILILGEVQPGPLSCQANVLLLSYVQIPFKIVTSFCMPGRLWTCTLCFPSPVAEVTGPASVYWAESRFPAYKYGKVCEVWWMAWGQGKRLWHAIFVHCVSDSKNLKILNYKLYLAPRRWSQEISLISIFALNI